MQASLQGPKTLKIREAIQCPAIESLFASLLVRPYSPLRDAFATLGFSLGKSVKSSQLGIGRKPLDSLFFFRNNQVVSAVFNCR